MKRRSLWIIIAVVIVLALGITATAAGLHAAKQNKLRREQDAKDVKFLATAIDLSFDLVEANDEQDYLNAMQEGDDIFDTFTRWEGIKKRQKQQAYFIQDDIEKAITDCADSCIVKDELVTLQRAVESRIKSFDQESVQESNELAGLSSEMLWKNFWHLINDLEIGKLRALPTSELDKIADRYFDTSVEDPLAMKEWCESLSSDYHEFARYQGNCDFDFPTVLRNLSTSAAEHDFDDPFMATMMSACSIEQKIKNLPDDAPIVCPHIGERNRELIEKVDAYVATLSAQQPSNSEPASPSAQKVIATKKPAPAPEPELESEPTPYSPTGLNAGVCEQRHGMFARYDIRTGTCDCAYQATMRNGRCVIDD